MTLSTDLYINGPIDPRVVFDRCVDLLQFGKPYLHRVDTDGIIGQAGQGADAWLMVHHADTPGQPVAATDDDCTEYCDAEDNYHHHRPAHYVRINWDTAYGFHERGLSCTTLHAGYIVDIGRWLDEQDIPWSWKNEYTSKVHTGYAALDDFVGDGDGARSWFVGTVVPVIHSMGGEVER